MNIDAVKRKYNRPVFSMSVKLIEVTAVAVVSGVAQ